MARSTNPFAEIFDDVSELVCLSDKEGLVSAKGIALLGDIAVKVTIERKDNREARKHQRASTAGKSPSEENSVEDSAQSVDCSNITDGKPLYTGTVTLIDPDNNVMISEYRRRLLEQRNSNYTPSSSQKELYASEVFRCNSPHIGDIRARLRFIVDRLILQNEEQYFHHLSLRITPEQVTPMMAVHQYVDSFLESLYPESKRNPERKRAIQEVFSFLRNVPIGTMSSREVTAILKKEAVTENNQEICHLFVNYLLTNRRIVGKNPIPSVSIKDVSPETLDKQAFTAHTLEPYVYSRLFALINKEYSTLHCVIVLLISGFTLADIRSLRWSEIEFVTGYEDFAIIHIRRDHYIVAKHDFSRPCIPETAEYLRHVREVLYEQFSPDRINSCFVWSTDPEAAESALKSSNVSKAVNDLLVRAGYVGNLIPTGRPKANEEPVPLRLLRTNYESMLALDAGLANDPDASHFLRGVLMRSSTYTHYESHTSPEAQYRLYTILKALELEKPIRRATAHRATNDGYVYTATPKTNHEVAQAFGVITLQPGERIKIVCPHGVTGRIEATPVKSDNGEKEELPPLLVSDD